MTLAQLLRSIAAPDASVPIRQLVLVVVAVGVVVLLVRLFWMAERWLAFKPTFEASPLWADVADLTLSQLDTAVSERRRDSGYELGEGNEACVVWAPTKSRGSGRGQQQRVKRRKTPLAIVYIHGWSAGVGEHRSTVVELGSRLGANVVCWRLSGHGRVNNTPTAENRQMVEFATVPNFYMDAVDALLVGLRLGERVVLVGSSTGAALHTTVAARAPMALKSRVAALVGFSPAYYIANPVYPIVGPLLAAVRALLPREAARSLSALLLMPVAGRYRCNLPALNEEHGRQWTLRYPTKGVLTSMECIWEAGHLDFKTQIGCPCFFAGNDRDHVVDWAVTISPQIYGSLKSVPRVALTVDPRPGDHPHVLGSALVSPGTVGEITDAAATFLGTYAGLVYA
jgi:pimeloyl-ACP methyl ester carboxylesterase